MKSTFLLASLLLFNLTACSHLKPNPPEIPSADAPATTLGPAIQDVLKDVQNALIRVQDDEELFEALPALSSVVLELSSSYDNSGNMKVNLLIFSIGDEKSINETSKLVITLKPPSEDTTLQISSNEIAEELYQMIKSAAIGVAEVGTNSDSNRYPLETSKLEAELSFGFVGKENGGISITIEPLKLEFGDKRHANHVQKIKLTFGK